MNDLLIAIGFIVFGIICYRAGWRSGINATRKRAMQRAFDKRNH